MTPLRTRLFFLGSTGSEVEGPIGRFCITVITAESAHTEKMRVFICRQHHLISGLLEAARPIHVTRGCGPLAMCRMP